MFEFYAGWLHRIKRGVLCYMIIDFRAREMTGLGIYRDRFYFLLESTKLLLIILRWRWCGVAVGGRLRF
jgi:hypothetical protein